MMKTDKMIYSTDERYNFFFNCYKKALEDRSITDFQKVIFLDILYYCELAAYKYCIITNVSFAKKYNKDKGTISRSISVLAKLGILKISYHKEFNYRILKINNDYFYKNNKVAKSDIVDDKFDIIDDKNDYQNNIENKRRIISEL